LEQGSAHLGLRLSAENHGASAHSGNRPIHQGDTRDGSNSAIQVRLPEVPHVFGASTNNCGKAGSKGSEILGNSGIRDQAAAGPAIGIDLPGGQGYLLHHSPSYPAVGVPPQPVSELLVQWKAGDQQALEKLVPLVYKELREIARYHLQRERLGHTLQSAALVHEAYLRLVDQEPFHTENRAHFLALASCLMRQILVRLCARPLGRQARCHLKVELDEAMVFPRERSAEVIALDDALNGLAELDEQQGRIVELRFFGGLSIEEIGEVLGLSRSTVKREWNVAKAWLSREMKRGSHGEAPAMAKS
jgi:RNA polymerase sigma-70 factor (ECF subfamily)